ncbi:MAG: AAA family ATPase [Clostridium sp.]|nr:AAA family ATPase [Clostridium sp.]
MIDWTYIKNSALDGFRQRLEAMPQPPHYHDEGNVMVHTQMVLEALESLPEYHSLPEHQRNILYVAAQLHDIGKIPSTKEIMGKIEASHHAPVGCQMARETIWLDYGLCGSKELQQICEAICLLIRYHSFPPHAIETKNSALRLHRIAANSLLVPDFSIRMLCILAKADMLGRICDDQEEMLDRISLCEEVAREEECYDGCFAFPSDYTRRAYLSGRDVWKNQDLHDDTWGEVILMSGLPGVGKDTWIQRNIPDLPMISLDEIRKELKYSPTHNQGKVANLARERAKELLRQHQPFVWNATNITAQKRESLVSLFETYRAHVRIVYLETDWQTQLTQNASREDAVPTTVLRDMLGKLSLPEAIEATIVEWVV